LLGQRIPFNLHGREENDLALKRSCDEARFFGLLKQADGSVTIFFFQDCDDGPQSNVCKPPDACSFRGSQVILQASRCGWAGGTYLKSKHLELENDGKWNRFGLELLR
jgi:hypothetical protein